MLNVGPLGPPFVPYEAESLKSGRSRNGDSWGNRTGDHRFPMNEGAADAPFIATRRLSGERTAAAKAQARACGATLNDFALTALYRSLFRTLALKPGDQLTIPLMVDMSRYLGERDAYPPLTNLSSMVASQLDYRPNETFDGALGRVKAVMDGKKELNLGLNAFAKLDFLFRIFGDRSAHGVLRKQMRQPLICMTNIGVLDEARLSLADLRPSDGFMCGSIKYKPYFQLAMSTYRGELTLSSNLYGDPEDRVRVDAFLEEVETQLSIAARSAALAGQRG